MRGVESEKLCSALHDLQTDGGGADIHRLIFEVRRKQGVKTRRLQLTMGVDTFRRRCVFLQHALQ